MVTKRTITALCITLFILFVSGCVGPRVVPEDHFYRLADLQPDKQLSAPLIKGSLAVSRIRTTGLYGERAILYVDAKNPLELRRSRYHFWQDTPGLLIQENLQSYLRKARFADKVVLAESGIKTDALLVGRLLRFESLAGPSDTVFVTMELGIRPVGQNIPEWSKDYSVSVPIKGSGVGEKVEAFGVALKQVYDAFIHDLQKQKQHDLDRS